MRRIVNPENGAAINLADLRLGEGLFKPGEHFDCNDSDADMLRKRFGFLEEGVYEEKKEVVEKELQQEVVVKPKRKYTKRQV